MKRILSLLLVLTMLCSLCTVFAQEEAPAEETAAEEVVETAPAEEAPAAEETAAEPAEEAAEEAPAEEVPAEESAEELPAEEPAAEAEEPAEDGEAEEAEIVTGAGDGLSGSGTTVPMGDAEELLGGYLNGILGDDLFPEPDSPAADGGSYAGDRLEGADKVVYDQLKTAVAEIAAGTRTSSVITVDLSEVITTDHNYTPDELGLSGDDLKGVMNTTTTRPYFDDKVNQATYAQVGLDMDAVMTALTYDCPYEMYWYGNSFTYEMPGCDYGWNTVDSLMVTLAFTYFTGTTMTVTLSVDSAYVGSSDTTVKNDAATAAAAAADTAKGVVSAAASLGDYEKLVYYRDWICNAVSYNSEAAASDYSGSREPWNIIYVFDNDSSTNVAADGYARAFQYLCDLTTTWTNSGIYCLYVTGTMSGLTTKEVSGIVSGPHAWNIVHMQDGKNYLVDVTNCDEGRIGGLFLCGASSASEGYITRFLQVYVYDTTLPYSSDMLTLSDTGYSEITGTCGDDLTWTLADGVLSISGTGAMYDYAEGKSPWYSDREQIKTAVFGNDVTGIGANAFYGCSALTGVILPSGLKSIGTGAFKQSGLTSVTIPDGVTAIADETFSGCGSLASLTLTTGVKSIGENAFLDCTGLTEVNYSGSVVDRSNCVWDDGNTALYDAAWNYSTYTVVYHANGGSGGPDTQSVVIGEAITLTAEKPEREGYTFMGWAESPMAEAAVYAAGETYTLTESKYLYAVWKEGASGTCGKNGDNLTWTIDALSSTLIISGDGEMADYTTESPAPWAAYKDDFAKVQVYLGVDSIGAYAFYDCSNIAELSLAYTVSTIGEGAFMNCCNVTSVDLSCVAYIYKSAFENCTGLLSVDLGQDVITIGDRAFYGCTSLEGISIPGGPESIGNYAFAGCRAMTSVTIPESVKLIGTNAFEDCECLESVSMSGNTLETIGEYAFANCALTSVSLPSSVTTIGDWAFYSCILLTGIEVPDSVVNFGTHVFQGCAGLASAVLPAGMTVIPSFTFFGCQKLNKLTIPENITSVGLYAFYNCDALTDVYYHGDENAKDGINISDGNDRLKNANWHYTFVVAYDANGGENAPAAQTGCIGEKLEITNAVPTRSGFDFLGWAENEEAAGVAYKAGDDYSGDADITLYAVWEETVIHGECGDGVTWVLNEHTGVLEISGSSNIAHYNISDNYSPFYAYRDYIKTVIIDEGVTGVGTYAFYGLSGITGVTFPGTLEFISRYAFSGCTGLTTVTIPQGVTQIMDYAFNYCTNLKTIYLPKSLTRVGTGAFRLAGLTDVYYAATPTDKENLLTKYIASTDNGPLINAAWHYTYTVTYDLNGAEGEIAPQTKLTGETLILPDTVPARENYIFLGWAEDSTCRAVAYPAGGSYTADASVTLYAVWVNPLAMNSARRYTANIENAGDTVWYKFTPSAGKTYVLYSGSEDVTIRLYNSDGKLLLTETNSLAWPMAADTTYYYTVSYADDTATGNIGLTFGRVYTLKFKANGGTGAPAAITRDYGTTVYLPDTIPEREGFFFLGWAGSTSAENAAYQPGDAYTANGNTTLYAVWAGLLPLKSGRSYTADIKAMSTGVYYTFTPANSNTYVLYANGGENVTITLYDEAGNVIGSSGEDASVTARLEAGETYVYRVSLNDGSAGSVSLKFGRVYTIRYKANGGTGAPAAQTRNYGSTLKLTDAEPVREGYTFLGWSASSTAEKATYTAGGDYTANGNVTLYAVWEKNP